MPDPVPPDFRIRNGLSIAAPQTKEAAPAPIDEADIRNEKAMAKTRFRNGLSIAAPQTKEAAPAPIDEADIRNEKAMAKTRFEEVMVPILDRLDTIVDSVQGETEKNTLRRVAIALRSLYEANDHSMVLDELFFRKVENAMEVLQKYVEKWPTQIAYFIANQPSFADVSNGVFNRGALFGSHNLNTGVWRQAAARRKRTQV